MSVHQLVLLLSWDVECSSAWGGSRGSAHRACPTATPTLRSQVLPSAATPQGKPASALHHPLLPPAPASSLHCPQHRATGTTSLSAPSPLTTADIIIPSSPAGADPPSPTAPHSPRAPCPTTLVSVDKGLSTSHVLCPAPHCHAWDMSSPRGLVCIPIHVPTSVGHPSACSSRPRHYTTVRSRKSSLVHPCTCPFPHQRLSDLPARHRVGREAFSTGTQFLGSPWKGWGTPQEQAACAYEAVRVELSSSVVRIRYSCARVSLRCCADWGSERVRRAGGWGSRLSSPGRDAGLSTGSSGSESSDVELPLLPGAARGAGSWLVRGEPAQRSERLRLWLRGPGEVEHRSWGKLASDLDLSTLAWQGRSCTGVRRRSRGEAGRGAAGAREGSCPSSAAPSGRWPKSRREAGESVP